MAILPRMSNVKLFNKEVKHGPISSRDAGTGLPKGESDIKVQRSVLSDELQKVSHIGDSKGRNPKELPKTTIKPEVSYDRIVRQISYDDPLPNPIFGQGALLSSLAGQSRFIRENNPNLKQTDTSNITDESIMSEGIPIGKSSREILPSMSSVSNRNIGNISSSIINHLPDPSARAVSQVRQDLRRGLHRGSSAFDDNGL